MLSRIIINHFLYDSCPAAELPDQDSPIESDVFQMFIKDLKQKRNNFRVVNTNKITYREFISSFMNSIVTHVRSKESNVVVLVKKAKKEDFEKIAVQNIIQIHSAIEIGK
ncbi:1954_t:CDS:2 [Funneliformis caledonium]|uniref:1954_t:CDS:1 n=1 Tax=Funneliformis caledonium TaxID=1117310 RepID=A0A9N8W012_9GLOM|nr:1954_t:CDS:2 [Funneliformis caledonium]